MKKKTNKIKVIKKKLTYPHKFNKKDYIYYFVYKDKNGKWIAFDSDTLA